MGIDRSLEEFIRGVPKAELHVHIEGTFEPELMFSIARRNGIHLRFDSVEQVAAAYHFSNLQDFLDIYYEGAAVLLHERDFHELTWNYLEKLNEQNVTHLELFFDPQTHTDRGVKFDTVINGILSAMRDAQQAFGISSDLIMCFLRHDSEQSAFETLERAQPFRDQILGVGLDSSEVGNPPSKFRNVFAEARRNDYRVVAHAGEEGPAEYIWEALELLNVQRIDHGNRCLEDRRLVEHLAERQMGLTVCPLSNTKLRVVDDLADHPLKSMMDANLLVTINSDDPAYFGGHLNDNYLAIAAALKLDQDDIVQLAKNSFVASFQSGDERKKSIDRIDQWVQSGSSNRTPPR